jgi:thioredoxin 1
MDLTRDQVDALPGATLLEFGTDWCGFCQAARPLIDQLLAEQPTLRHIKVADGKGRRLGRSFGVKLWPSLIMMQDGSEVARVVRPRSVGELRHALHAVEAHALHSG